jgi:hypothetical protein
MSRIAYCREQARFCRDAAAQVSVEKDAARLREIAMSYEAEADALQKTDAQPAKQPSEQRPGQT